MSEKKVPDMPIPEKDLSKMELADLRKEVATLRLFVASLKEQVSDYVDKERLPDALNSRIAGLDEQIGLTANSITSFERMLIEHRTLPHDLTDLSRSIQSLSRRIDTLERKQS